MKKIFSITLFVCVICFSLLSLAMPGKMAKEFYGKPLLSDILAPGVVTVKVIGKDLKDVKADALIKLVAKDEGKSFEVKTNDEGRAIFSKLKAGREFIAELNLGSSVIRSDAFKIPEKGGLRILLSIAAQEAIKAASSQPTSVKHAASKPTQAAGSTTPIKDASKLVFGRSSHLLGQVADGLISFRQVLELKNLANAPVDVQGMSIAFPIRANGLTLISKTPFVEIKGEKLVFIKPVPVGKRTIVTSFQIASDGPTLDFRQKLSIPLPSMLMAITNNDRVKIHGPTLLRREMRQNTPVFVFNGVKANSFFEFTLSGLPFRDTRPRNIAVILSIVIGLWMIAAVISSARSRRAKRAEKEALLNQLSQLERDHRDEEKKLPKKKYQSEKKALVEKLKAIWD